MGQTVSCFSASGNDFLKAVRHGDYELAQSQLQHDIGLVTCSNIKGWTGLHCAAQQGDLKLLQDLVHLLKTRTADILRLDHQRKKERSPALDRPSPQAFLLAQLDRANARGQTPLMLACKYGHLTVVQYLVREGASALKEDKAYRRTCLHYAAKSGHSDCIQFLLADTTIVQSDSVPTPLHSVRVQDVSGISQRYVDVRAAGGFTPLHLASYYGRVEAVKALLAAGANLMATSYNMGHTGLVPCETGSTPLHVAAMRGQEAVAVAILDAHLQAMGTLGREENSERYRWEGSDRLDPRVVRNLRRETPYRLALAFGHRPLVTLLDPTLPILWVLRPEEADGSPLMRGPPTLANIAAKALREHLLSWLGNLKTELDVACPLKEPEPKDTAIQPDNTPDPPPPSAPLASLNSPRDRTAAASTEVPPTAPQPSDSSIPDTLPDRAPRPTPVSSPFANYAPPSPPSRPPQPHHTHSLSADAASLPWASADHLSAILAHPPPPPQPLHNPTPSSLQRFESLPEEPSLPSAIKRPLTHAPSAPLNIPARFSADEPRPNSAVDDDPGSPHVYTSCWFVPRSRNPDRGGHSRSGSLISPSTLEALLDPPLTTLRALPSLYSRNVGKDARGTPIVLHSQPQGNRLRMHAVRSMATMVVRPMLSLTQRKAEPQPSIKGWGGEGSLSDGSDRECGICLDNPQQLAIRGCGHRLCLSCTRALCADSHDPALCPFCRRFIGGFERIPLPHTNYHLTSNPLFKDV